MTETFELNRQVFRYYRKRRFKHERLVELPIARHFIQDYPANLVLEVGNVMHQYFDTRHDVVDLYELDASNPVINADIAHWRPPEGKKYWRIICISTLEHVGVDGNDPETADAYKPIVAVYNLLWHALRKGGFMLVTTPWGWNHALDRAILNKDLPYYHISYMQRIAKTEWQQCGVDEVQRTKYGNPWANANGLVIMEFDKL